MKLLYFYKNKVYLLRKKFYTQFGLNILVRNFPPCVYPGTKISWWVIRILFIYCLNFLKIQSLYLFLAVIKKSIREKIPADSLADAVKKIF